MDDQIPVKVVDRRWWARGDDGDAPAADRSLKPTYVQELERKLEEKDKQAQEYLSKYRQASQEFDDARARMRKELARDAERNRREVIVSLLEVLDNLDRAVDAARKAGAGSDDPLLEGVDLVRQQFRAKLESFGVRRIDPEGAPFDPLLHEAVTAVPSANPGDDGRVVGVIRAGYQIGEEVLRPALVAVAQSRQPAD
jgi:molecular chaperone GrpE